MASARIQHFAICFSAESKTSWLNPGFWSRDLFCTKSILSYKKNEINFPLFVPLDAYSLLAIIIYGQGETRGASTCWTRERQVMPNECVWDCYDLYCFCRPRAEVDQSHYWPGSKTVSIEKATAWAIRGGFSELVTSRWQAPGVVTPCLYYILFRYCVKDRKERLSLQSGWIVS